MKKTATQHALEGTYRADRHGKGRPSPEPGSIGDPPSWLSRAAKAEWQRLQDHPVFGQILTDVDRDILAEYLVLRDKMIANAKDGSKFTATERQRLNSLRMQFGLSPKSRGQIEVPSAMSEKKSKWEMLRRGYQMDPLERAIWGDPAPVGKKTS